MLAVALGAVGWFTWPRPRRRSHWSWIGRATVAFALPALLTTVALGRPELLSKLPPEFAPLSAPLPLLDPVSLLPALAAGLPLGLAFVWLRIWWLRRRGQPLPASIVAPAPLAARSRGEIWPALTTALAAGVTEELAFRLALPLLVAIVSGSALFGFVLATVMFVGLHRYQPWFGQIGVGLTAVALAAAYLATGALWFVIVVHALIDVVALVVRPWLAGFSSSAASRF